MKVKSATTDKKKGGQMSFQMIATVGLLLIVFVCIYGLLNDAIYAAVGALLSSPICYIKVKKSIKERKEKKLEAQFVNVLSVMSASLSSGMRIEECVKEIAESSTRNYSEIRPEFIRMQKLIEINVPVEKAFRNFADRTNSMRIKVFAQALTSGIPAGINLVELVRNISSEFRIEQETDAEIRKTLNLPKYNNRIIILMPFVLMYVIRATSGDYLNAMDGSVGRIILFACAILIGLAVVLGEAIGNVKV